MLKINHLAVRLGFVSKRPEPAEGKMAKANYDTASEGMVNMGIGLHFRQEHPTPQEELF